MAVLPSDSQETNHLILARTVHREVPHTFTVLDLLLTNERSDSAESLNMLRIWIPIRTSSESIQEDPGNAPGPFHPN